MSFLGYVISLLVSGLVIGGLGRLAIPGPNPMSIWATIGIGVVGSLIGSVVAGLIGGGIIIALILEIAASAGLVYVISHRGGQLTRR